VPGSVKVLPTPLAVALGLTALEAGALLVLGALELLSLNVARATMGVTTSVFFLVYGGALLLCAWGALRLSPWSRSPIVLAQLIQLGVAWSFRGGETTLVATGLALVAVAVLVGVLHPRSLAALRDDPVADDR
jgi:hypothetical protein